MKIRLYTIASELGIQNAELVKKCRNLGFSVRNHMSTLEEGEAHVIKRAIEREHQKPAKETVLRNGILLRKAVQKPQPPEPKPEPIQVPPPAPVPVEIEAGLRITDEAVDESESSIWPPPDVSPSAPSDSAVVVASSADVLADQRDLLEDADAASAAFDEDAAASDMEGEPQLPQDGATEAITGEDAETTDSSGPRIVGQIELPKPQVKVPGKPTTKAAEAAAALLQRQIPGKKGEVKRPARRIEEMRASAVPSWDARSKRPRKKKVAPGTKTRKTEITTPKAIKRIVRIEGQISLQELAKSMEVKATEVLMKLIKLGMSGVNINSTLDVDSANIVAAEFNYEVADVSFEEEGLLQEGVDAQEDEGDEDLEPRAPVVTVMGHVDHGKTSLLDAIRQTKVASGEAGGITQSIGASEIHTNRGKVVFVDTPGHAAFTEMRARGANVTDIVVLVVAANDGVQAQTIESLNHAKAADVPIVVAINKMDLPNANPDRVRKELADHGILGEDWGGENLFIEVSAEKKTGLDSLLESILLQAEILDLRSNPDRPVHGTVLEARLDKGKGPVATVLVQDGTLRAGDSIVAGKAYGRVRAMTDAQGKQVREAFASTAVEVIGLNTVPFASDPVDGVADQKKAQLVGESRASKIVTADAPEGSGTALGDMLSKIRAGEKADLKVILKADVQGSLEAVRNAILKLGTEKVGTSVIHASVGGITETDVNLASASGAIVVGFNVRPAGKARNVADTEKVEVRMYTVIYDMLDDLKRSMVGLLEPVVEEVILGSANVKQAFNITKMGTIAGCEVTEGKVLRTASARLVRDSAVVWTGKLKSLRHFKDDVKEVVAGLECGVGLDGFNDIKAGDVMEFFEHQEREASLD